MWLTTPVKALWRRSHQTVILMPDLLKCGDYTRIVRPCVAVQQSGTALASLGTCFCALHTPASVDGARQCHGFTDGQFRLTNVSLKRIIRPSSGCMVNFFAKLWFVCLLLHCVRPVLTTCKARHGMLLQNLIPPRFDEIPAC